MIAKANILWLSDIHFCHEDKKYTRLFCKAKNRLIVLSAYFESISKKILDIKPTHIIITGDLSFSGDYKQLESMYNTLLKPYLDDTDEGRQCVLLTCAGNHDFSREIFHSLLPYVKVDMIPLKDEYKKYTKLSQFDKVVVEERKQFASISKNIHNPKKINGRWFKGKDFSFIDLCFINYQKFWDKYVITRINSLNSTNRFVVDLDGERNEGKVYKEDSCLYGVITDTLYRFNFVISNSAWFSWGQDTYEKLHKKGRLVEEFDEYGNLTVGHECISFINSIINGKQKNYFGSDYLSFLLMHHSFSWLSYKEIHRNSSFIKLVKKMDVVLSGHIHVPHYNASLFRNSTWVFESPQLFDYHLYFENSPSEVADIGSTHGFSTFRVHEDLGNLLQQSYGIKNSSSVQSGDQGNPNPFLASSPIPFDWIEVSIANQFESEYTLSNKKQLHSLFGIAYHKRDNWCDYIVRVAQPFKGNHDKIIEIDSNCILDIRSYVKSAGLSIDNEFEVDNEGKKRTCYYSKNEAAIKLVLDAGLEDLDSLRHFIYEILSNCIEEERICSKIHLLIYDFQIFKLNLTDKRITLTAAYELVRCVVARLKHEVAELISEKHNSKDKKNVDISNFYMKVGLGFDIVYFKDYKSSVYSVKVT